MAELFDDLCRTLATPMPRSRALKLILGGRAGAALSPFAFGQGRGRGSGPKQQCPGNKQACGDTCCPPSQECCLAPNGAFGVCCPPSYSCDSASGRCCKSKGKGKGRDKDC